MRIITICIFANFGVVNSNESESEVGETIKILFAILSVWRNLYIYYSMQVHSSFERQLFVVASSLGTFFLNVDAVFVH